MADKQHPSFRLERGFWIVSAVFALLSVMATIYWLKTPIDFWMPQPAVDKADQIDSLFRFLTASGSVLFIFVAGYLIYFTIRFRARKSDPPDAIGVQIHDSNTLEMWWTIVPTVFVVIMAIFSVKIWYGIEVARPASAAMTVESIGHQWYYTFRYPGINGEITDSMHLPIGVPVTMEVTSTDVIHSFWVPAMRLKEDMIPGMINTFEFTPEYPGTYKIICTEFCGVQHAVMEKQTVVIESKADFDKWYAGWQAKNKSVSNAVAAAGATTAAVSLAGGDAAAGEKLFATKCSACHSAAGGFDQKIVGPGLKGVLHDPSHPNLVDGDPATPANVAKILQKGYTGSIGTMPNQTANGLADKDIANLVAYLDSLK